MPFIKGEELDSVVAVTCTDVRTSVGHLGIQQHIGAILYNMAFRKVVNG